MRCAAPWKARSARRRRFGVRLVAVLMPPPNGTRFTMTAALGFAATALSIALVWPQVWLSCRHSRTGGLSPTASWLGVGLNLCWLTFGLLTGDPAQIVTNAVVGAGNSAVLAALLLSQPHLRTPAMLLRSAVGAAVLAAFAVGSLGAVVVLGAAPGAVAAALVAVGLRNRVEPDERPDVHALEDHLGVVGQPFEHRREVVRADACVEAPHVLRHDVSSLDVLAEDCVHDAVDPPVVAAVCLPLHALLDPADALRVPARPLVVRVDLHLQAVEAEAEDQVPLKETRSRVREVPAAEVRMNREPLEVRDAAALVHTLEAHGSRGAPVAVVVALDHEAPERRRIVLLLFELGEQGIPLERAARGEIRPHLVVREDAEHEVGVVAGRTADAYAVGPGLHHGS